MCKSTVSISCEWQQLLLNVMLVLYAINSVTVAGGKARER